MQCAHRAVYNEYKSEITPRKTVAYSQIHFHWPHGNLIAVKKKKKKVIISLSSL